MKQIILFSTLLIISTSCKQQGEDVNEVAEASHAGAPANRIGVGPVKGTSDAERILSIPVQVKVEKEDKKVFPKGIMPWIGLDKPETARLLKGNEVVLQADSVEVIIVYPLSHEDVFRIRSASHGFTRQQLIEEVSKRYHEIYATEEKTSTVKIDPFEDRTGRVNRNETNGKYGIWGHALSDLHLAGFQLFRRRDGSQFLMLDIIP